MPDCKAPAVWDAKLGKCVIPNKDPGFSKNAPKTKFKGDPGFSKNAPKTTNPKGKSKTNKSGMTLFKEGGSTRQTLLNSGKVKSLY